ncbi:MAG TPA: hypothetical protein VIT65_14180 [Microlunatus sp.]
MTATSSRRHAETKITPNRATPLSGTQLRTPPPSSPSPRTHQLRVISIAKAIYYYSFGYPEMKGSWNIGGRTS